MADHETKLKLGRKLKAGDASTASDNQVSVLFRCDERGNDGHVSITIESDQMGPEDVRALLDLLAQRGVFTSANSKTWVSQPQSSESKYGSTTTWKGSDINQLAKGA
jgi:hypothetical protein